MLSKETVEHVAKLARLKISAAELGDYRDMLSKVLQHFEQIAKVNTDGIEPLLTPTDMSVSLREDAVARIVDIDQMLSNAPEKSGRLFKVPPVV